MSKTSVRKILDSASLHSACIASYLLVFACVFPAMPTQVFSVTPVWWSHVTEDLATVNCLCFIEIRKYGLLNGLSRSISRKLSRDCGMWSVLFSSLLSKDFTSTSRPKCCCSVEL